jgi:hypothetical protein
MLGLTEDSSGQLGTSNLSTPERRYDAEADRLFVVYYALPPGSNANKWGVSHRSLDRNIKTGINKPVIMYRKNPNLHFHTRQAGNFVHPTPEEAAYELGQPPSEKQYYEWQENKGVVGRVVDIDKRPKGYAFTYDITDPEAKEILLRDEYKDGIPGWTSPQIITNDYLYPEEARTGIFDHWSIAHVILTDNPAYGYDKASIKAKCLGPEQVCMIKTKSASTTKDLGYCVKQATIDLVNAHSTPDGIVSVTQSTDAILQSTGSFDSSHHTKDTDSSHTMSTNEAPKPNAAVATGDTLTYKATVSGQPQATDANNTNTVPVNASTPQESEEQKGEKERNTPPGQEEETRIADAPRSLDEAVIQIRQMNELMREQGKQLKIQGKELERINRERKQYKLASIIPRDLFKSDDSHMKEGEKAMGENVSESFLIDHWKTKRELELLKQGHNPNPKMEEPLKVKSASLEVPDFNNNNSENNTSQNTKRRSVIDKTLELSDMILGGGGSF